MLIENSPALAKRKYDIKLYTRQYEVGEPVYVLDSAVVKGQCKKLAQPWKGPALVEQRITPYLYRIQMHNKSTKINHDRLKRCRDRVLPAWLKRRQREMKIGTSDDMERETTAEEYCICRKPDDGRLMVECSQCGEWFHCSCVNLSKTEAEELEEYLCPFCGPIKMLD